MPRRAQVRHWSRVAFAIAILFFCMAVGSKLLLGEWPFDGSLELSLLCLTLAATFYIVGMRRVSPLPDPSAFLEQAFQFASSGRIDEAMAILNRAIGENPHFWQAYQYRGELYLLVPDYPAAAGDFDEAIRLAPEERHLYQLRERANGPGGAASDFGTTPATRDSEVK